MKYQCKVMHDALAVERGLKDPNEEVIFCEPATFEEVWAELGKVVQAAYEGKILRSGCDPRDVWVNIELSDEDCNWDPMWCLFTAKEDDDGN